MVKIVTYNVNGLRPRVAQHGSLRRLLDALDADIICFQVRPIDDSPLAKLRPPCVETLAHYLLPAWLPVLISYRSLFAPH
jgi:hypothetical protein